MSWGRWVRSTLSWLPHPFLIPLRWNTLKKGQRSVSHWYTYLCLKFCAWEWNFLPGYNILCLGVKFCARVWNFVPGYESLCLGMKFCVWSWNVVPGNEILCLGMKFCALVWNFVPGYEILCLGMKVCTPLKNYLHSLYMMNYLNFEFPLPMYIIQHCVKMTGLEFSCFSYWLMIGILCFLLKYP
jgi:hypothetical protein